ncbi:unnamed protein product [Triticum turgidum subsp. durum]|uniref:Uncharacterized protein n=1 Tax=Triticum turgidum subsp. durum TaxID=4567 RepID=A0A9R0XR94_TRITD|nr:unnamed protein product [Triticum turgidum subsp. durum]
MSFHGGSSSGTGGDDGPSAWSSSLSTLETEELYRFGLLVPPGCRLSHDWKLDKDGYPRRGPGATAEEKRTGGRINIAGRHAFWDDKDYAAVIGAYRLAESGVTPDLIGDRRRLLVPRPRPEACGRRAPPPPAPAPADPPAPPEQLVLREDGDLDDTPGYLVALRASVAAAAAAEAAAAAREAAEQAAVIQAAAAIPPVVPQAEAESSDEDVIDWERLAQVSDDDDDGGGGDGAAGVIDLAASDDEE